MRKIVFLNLSFVILVSCKTVNIKTANELFHKVNTGDIDDHYHNKFIAEKSGKSDSITITGSKNAVISGLDYGFWLKANYWIVKGFTVTTLIKELLSKMAIIIF